MSRKPRTPLKNIEQYDFDRLSKTTGCFRERRRYLAFAHIQAGETFIDTAKMVRVNLRTLMNWVKNFVKVG